MTSAILSRPPDALNANVSATTHAASPDPEKTKFCIIRDNPQETLMEWKLWPVRERPF